MGRIGGQTWKQIRRPERRSGPQTIESGLAPFHQPLTFIERQNLDEMVDGKGSEKWLSDISFSKLTVKTSTPYLSRRKVENRKRGNQVGRLRMGGSPAHSGPMRF